LAVAKRWNTLVAGDYVVPECPSSGILREVLEMAYLASSAAEEARYPQFNLLVTPKTATLADTEFGAFPFDRPRPLAVSELRRLAPASDIRKSAIWIGYDDRTASILGLVDLGTAWHRARLGLGYKYHVPHHLIVQVDRPGRLKVYQGQFYVATLSDGDLVASAGIDIHLFLHKTIEQGFRGLMGEFSIPTHEQPRDYESFWFIAIGNVFTAIVNSISLSGHGGTLIIADRNSGPIREGLKVKYSSPSELLRRAFISFINARNRTADFIERSEQSKNQQPTRGHLEAELSLVDATDRLVEAIRFVAQLAGCDGAIVLTPDLTLIGFGAEIRAEMESGVGTQDVVDEMRRKYQDYDVEQFGMRHRSAVKLASKEEGVLVMAVSQDGPISAFWKEGDRVLVKRGVSMANMNMPWG
jgi:hypothetical protein